MSNTRVLKFAFREKGVSFPGEGTGLSFTNIERNIIISNLFYIESTSDLSRDNHRTT
jgi:hypothetical protein